MKEITLSTGYKTQVDDEDYQYLSQFNWTAQPNGNTIYAYRIVTVNKDRITIMMHQEVAIRHSMSIRPMLDHKDRNGLNNQSLNIRTATNSENTVSGITKRGKVGFRGLTKIHKTDRYQVRLCHEGITHNLGNFDNIIIAAKTYDCWAVWYWGDFAQLNFPEDRHKYITKEEFFKLK